MDKPVRVFVSFSHLDRRRDPLGRRRALKETRFGRGLAVLFVALLGLAACSEPPERTAASPPAAGPVDERSPSRSHYFDWINSQYEGTTEAQTLANMAFFQWLHDEYGFTLDIYSLDVGNIDDGPYTAGVGRLIPHHYGSLDTPEFKAQFPRGFAPLAAAAAGFGARLGVWMGPDGFGDTPEEERARAGMLLSLCRDFDFAAFKFDAVAGQLRPEKQAAFRRAIEACRAVRPDLIVQNHRVRLGSAEGVETVSLWEGVETYIDVFMPNDGTASHHRAGALGRELPPNLTRRLEDHGVCLSSCLDGWDDDLVLQAFNRALLLSPSIYGNPWLLKDEEFPKLARIFNLQRRYRGLLTEGSALPADRYGPFAVSRGNGETRFITLRNLSWDRRSYTIRLDGSIGLDPGGEVEVRRFHPEEALIGRLPAGSDVAVEVDPFRSCLVSVSKRPLAEIGVEGAAYDVIRDVPGKPAVLRLLGEPGDVRDIRLIPGNRRFRRATLDGTDARPLLEERSLRVTFPGRAPQADWHRGLGALEPCPVPADAETLFEAACFAADNNALEVRSLLRSGPSAVPQVNAAREAFFDKPMFVNRGVWDRNLFDGKTGTAFIARLPARSFRLDLGRPERLDRIVLKVRDRQAADLSPDLDGFGKEAVAEVSEDLAAWTPLRPAWGGRGTIAVIDAPRDKPVRYFRMSGAPRRLSEVEAFRDGRPLERSGWRASNLFPAYSQSPAAAAWRRTVRLGEVRPNAYLAVAVNGRHGAERAVAALRIDGRPVGAPDRAVSFPSNTWEYFNVDSEGDSTFYFPLSGSMAGRSLEVVVLILEGGTNEVSPEVWLTAWPPPRASRDLVLRD